MSIRCGTGAHSRRVLFALSPTQPIETEHKTKRLREAVWNAMEPLEGRVLLSTTTIDHTAGFAGATDIQLNGTAGATPDPAIINAAGDVQLLDGMTGGQATSAFDTKVQGVDTFDTTFKFDFGTVPPQADGFAFVIQNDPKGPAALGPGGGFMGFSGGGTNGIANGVGIKFDLWDNTIPDPKDTSTASGVFTSANGVQYDPRQTLSTTPAPINNAVDFSTNPDGSSSGVTFHTGRPNANPDQYQVHLVYDGTTLTETLSDLTTNTSATQTYTINIPSLVTGHFATVGFTGGDGGAFSTPEISSWKYQGVGSSQLVAPALTAQPGVGGEVDLNWAATGAPTGFQLVESSDNGATFSPLATLPATATNYQAVGLDPTKTYQFEIKALGDGVNTTDSPFSAPATASAAGAAPVLLGYTLLPGQATLHWTESATTATGFELDSSTDNGATFAPAATFAPGSSTYTLKGLDTSKTYEFKLRALGNGTTTSNTPFSDVITVSGAGPSASSTIDLSKGFTPGSVQTNGTATLTGPNGNPANALELTHALGGEGGSGFVPQLVGVDTFDTTFQWTYGTVHAPGADGFSFTLQNNDPGALGGTGGSLSLIGNKSVAVIFNLYPNVDQTAFAIGGTIGTKLDLTTDPNTGNPSGIDFHAHPGDTFQAHLVYDGTNLTETVTDETLIAQGKTATFTTTYSEDIPTLLGGTHTAFAGFTGADGGVSSQQDILNLQYKGTGTLPPLPNPVAVANSAAPGVVDVGWTDDLPASGFEVDQSTDNGVTFTKIASLPASANHFEVANLNPAIAYQFQVKALGVGTVPTLTSNAVTITPAAAAPGPIDFSAGFGDVTNLQLNGSATAPNSQLQITPNSTGQGGSAFDVAPQDISGFDTTFDFTYGPSSTPPADGFAFVIQNSPAGDMALGGTGGGLGYGPDNNAAQNAGGIPNSVAIKFDIFQNNAEGNNSTGLFTNGDAPTSEILVGGPDKSVDLTASGVKLGTTDKYHVELMYNGQTLTETLTDVTTDKTFTQNYTINLSQFIKGRFAYVGFSGGTGGLTAEQDILDWKFTTVPGTGASDTITGTGGNDTITLKMDGANIDWTLQPPTGAAQTGSLPINDPNGLTINGGTGTETIVFDSSSGDPLPNLLKLNGTFSTSTVPPLGTGQKIDLEGSTVQINYPAGNSVLPAVQSALKGGQIFSSTLTGKLAISDTDTGSAIVLKPALPGDTNLSGKVDFTDLVNLARNYGKSGADWAKGDFNYDGKVDFSDLVALARNYGQASPATTAAVLNFAAALSPAVSTDVSGSSQKQTRKPLSRRLK